MKKIFTFVIALCTVLSISAADGSKTKIWEGDQVFDSSWPGIVLSASLFAEATATDHLVFDIKSVDPSLSEGWEFGPQIMIKDNTWADMNPSWMISGFGVGEVVADFDEAKLAVAQAGGIIIQGQQMEITAIYLMGSETPGPIPGEKEVYVALTTDNVLAPEFAAVVDPETQIATNVVDGSSKLTFNTKSMDCEAVSSANPNDVECSEAEEFGGWTAGYKDVKWEKKNQGDISFYYVLGTGNPAVVMGYTKKESASAPNGYVFTPDWTYYMSDGSNGLPKMGLYYKFSPKASGVLTIKIWANKGNRRTFFVDNETMKALPYQVAGYINGQNEKIWDPTAKEGEGDSVSVKKWLTNDEIQALHDAAGKTDPEDAYIIGAGNQPFWGNLNVNVEAGKTYWLFQHSSQVGFAGYEFSSSVAPVPEAEEYIALTTDNELAPEFAAVVDPETQIATNVVDGSSTLNFSTANMDCEGVSSANPNDVECAEADEFAGWIAGYKDVKWEKKNQGDISFYYVLGTGNPAVVMGYTKKESASAPDGYVFTPDWTYYMSDGSNGLPKMGLYYKFSPKCDGALSIKVWANKGNRRTFFVDNETMKALPYTVEGYINGQNEKIWDPTAKEGEGDSVSVKKWLTNDEIQALHDAAGKTDPEDAYIIGAGNQPFWGNVNVNVKGGKTYWLFQHSSQVGFAGYKFTPGDVPTPAGLKGDADEDEEVTVSDITTIAAYILGNNPSPFNSDNADVDNDGEITVSDITGTAGIILGK